MKRLLISSSSSSRVDLRDFFVLNSNYIVPRLGLVSVFIDV